jgi:hypothetical protein
VAAGIAGSREPQPKKIALGELDDLMDKFLDAENPPQDDDENFDVEVLFEDTTVRVALPYALDTCIDLWYAWNDHGVTPLPGGYLDQPRKWRALIHLLNGRKNRRIDARERDKKDADALRGELGA